MLASTQMRHTADSVLSDTQRTLMYTIKEVLKLPNIKMPGAISLLMGALENMNSTGYTGLLDPKQNLKAGSKARPFDFGTIRTSISDQNNGLTGGYQIYDDPQARDGVLTGCDEHGNAAAITATTEYFKITNPDDARKILRVGESIEIPTGYENTNLTNEQLCTPEICRIVGYGTSTDVIKVDRGFTRDAPTYNSTAAEGSELKWHRGPVFTPEGGSPPRPLSFGLRDAVYYVSKFQEAYEATKDFEGAMANRMSELNTFMTDGNSGKSITLNPLEMDQAEAINRLLNGIEAALMSSRGKAYPSQSTEDSTLYTTHGLIPFIAGDTPHTEAYDLVHGKAVSLENRKRIWKPQQMADFSYRNLSYFISATKMYWPTFDDDLWIMGSLTGLNVFQQLAEDYGDSKKLPITEVPNKLGIVITEIHTLGGVARLMVSPYLERNMRDKLICINPKWFSLITNKDAAGNSRATLKWEGYGDNTEDSSKRKIVCNLGLLPWASNKMHSLIDLSQILKDAA